MAHIVLLRGVNVGGHRTFRPTALAEQLKHLDAINIGAAGTFVIRQAVTQSKLRVEIARLLPFKAQAIIIRGSDLSSLLALDYFADKPVSTEFVRFVGILAGRPRSTPTMPLICPPTGKWLMKILARKGRFIVGIYRRQMRAIGYLGSLDRLFGAPVTIRNWNTIATISRLLDEKGRSGRDADCP